MKLQNKNNLLGGIAMEMGWKDYKDCEIMDVYQKIVGNVGRRNNFLVEVRYYDKEKNPHFVELKIDKSDMYKELIELVNGKRDRVYASHNMADIDIFKDVNSKTKAVEYCIEWSPTENSYHTFYFKEKNFLNYFVNAFKVIEDEKNLETEEDMEK